MVESYHSCMRGMISRHRNSAVKEKESVGKQLQVWVWDLHSKVSLVCGHSYLSVSVHVVGPTPSARCMSRPMCSTLYSSALKRSCHFLLQSSRRLRSDCRTSLSMCVVIKHTPFNVNYISWPFHI